MTRSTLRLAQICAAALAAGILAAALAQATWSGLAYTTRLLAVVGACGTVASLGWHGTAAAVERHEERKRLERRHRVPRPASATMARRPRTPGPQTAEDAPPSADAETMPELWSPPEAEEPRDPEIDRAFRDFEQAIDPYLAPPTPRWMSETEAAQYEDLYAHPPTGSA